MKTALSFRSRLAFGGEILTQQATFLPVGPVDADREAAIYASEMQHFTGFLPVFRINKKYLTVAQPLLKEVCDEMR